MSTVWTPLDLLRSGLAFALPSSVSPPPARFSSPAGIAFAPCSSGCRYQLFPPHSWAWLSPIYPALPLGTFPVGSGAPLSLFGLWPGGEPAMQAAPSIAVQVFPLAGRPGPGLGASCLARQGTGRGRRYLAFFLCRKPSDVGPQVINTSCFRLASNRLAVHPAPPFFEVNTVDKPLTFKPRHGLSRWRPTSSGPPQDIAGGKTMCSIRRRGGFRQRGRASGSAP